MRKPEADAIFALLVIKLKLGEEEIGGPGLWRHNDEHLKTDEYQCLMSKCIDKPIRSFQKRNFTQSTKCCSLNLALTPPTAQANIFRQNPADWQLWPVDNSNN
jgi:hypothetical protein